MATATLADMGQDHPEEGPATTSEGQQEAHDVHVDRLHRAIMDRTPSTRSWHVPAHDGERQARLTLRLPKVTITDGAGRSITLTPKQSAVLGRYLTDIMDWLDEAPVE